MIFLVFCGIFLMMNWVTVNIYLFVWDAMMLATACGYLKRENEAFLRKILHRSRQRKSESIIRSLSPFLIRDLLNGATNISICCFRESFA